MEDLFWAVVVETIVLVGVLYLIGQRLDTVVDRLVDIEGQLTPRRLLSSRELDGSADTLANRILLPLEDMREGMSETREDILKEIRKLAARLEEVGRRVASE